MDNHDLPCLTDRMKIYDDEGLESMAPPTPLQPRPPARFAQMRFCFEAYVNIIWATEGIFKILILPLVIHC